MASIQESGAVLRTKVLDVNTTEFGSFQDAQTLEKWQLPRDFPPGDPLVQAAEKLWESNIPVGFPTETVYGLGADATRSDAVKGIYKAKGRPSDNPLITHVCDLTMLREYLGSSSADPIPEIYKPLIKAFWPGPLTILLPNPVPSKLAPEVTAGLPTFGARMPLSPLALSLIKLTGRPLAAPSANASTKPSPTTAAHVLHDLSGRIELILNGGPCGVGVESTVVDGLCSPPAVLRPGGISIDQLRQCSGWEDVVKGYKDKSEVDGGSAPRAPGMKYKHYSPKAKVVLYEAATNGSRNGIPLEIWRILAAKDGQISHLGLENAELPIKIGIVSTKHWCDWAGFHEAKWSREKELNLPADDLAQEAEEEWDSVVVNHGTEEEPRYELEETSGSWTRMMCNHSTLVYPTTSSITTQTPTLDFQVKEGELWQGSRDGPAPLSSNESWEDEFVKESRQIADLYEVALGADVKNIARGLFAVLREFDSRGVDVIYVEGIQDEGDIAAAVMNRLRKAASMIEK